MVAQAAARRPVGNFLSRILVAAAGLPLVLGLFWLGGWWLFALITAAGFLALHEFYWMTRPLRPLVIAGYAGLLLILFGLEFGGSPGGALGRPSGRGCVTETASRERRVRGNAVLCRARPRGAASGLIGRARIPRRRIGDVLPAE